MGKKSRVKARATAVDGTSEAGGDTGAAGGVPGPRQPCPCGSGRRYKACHGNPDEDVFVPRPFAGLAGECDLVAMREFVPSATAPVRLLDSDRSVLIGSLLPGASPAVVRQDGTIWLGLQVGHAYGDPSRDLAAVLVEALDAEPGEVVGLSTAPGSGHRLQDLVAGDPLEVSVHEGFDWWVADLDDTDGAMAAALEQANATVAPTARVDGVEAAYWTTVGGREYLRWAMPEAEDSLLDALARLHAARADSLLEGDRLLGMFRAHGVLVPVWDLPVGTGAGTLAAPAQGLLDRLREALVDDTPLTTQERATRAGLANRQLTIR